MMNGWGLKVGSTGSTYSPYQNALNDYEERRSALVQLPLFNPEPPPLRDLLVEEAFSLFSMMLGCGLDEESLTASFMTCLASSHRFWQRIWVWDKVPSHEVLWMHINKKSETALGIDFVVALTGDDGRVNLISVQAKRYSKFKSNLKRFAYRGDVSEDAEKADEGLRSALASQVYCKNVESPQWQITRFLSLQDDMRKVDKAEGEGDPLCVYAFWPDENGDPLYEDLDVAAEKIKAKIDAAPDATASVDQSVELDSGKLFRDLLLDEKTAMSRGRAIKVLTEIKEKVSALIVIDVGGKNFGNELAQSLSVSEIKPTHEAKQTSTNDFTPP